MLLTEQVKRLAQQIGQWAMGQKGNNYDAACQMIRDMRIKELIPAGDHLIIKTERPGLVIGPRGGRVSSLEGYLGKHIHIIEVDDELESWLMPVTAPLL